MVFQSMYNAHTHNDFVCIANGRMTSPHTGLCVCLSVVGQSEAVGQGVSACLSFRLTKLSPFNFYTDTGDSLNNKVCVCVCGVCVVCGVGAHPVHLVAVVCPGAKCEVALLAVEGEVGDDHHKGAQIPITIHGPTVILGKGGWF